MKYIYSDNRNKRETKIIDAAIRNTWTVSDIFQVEMSLFQHIKMNQKDSSGHLY
jgi:hypothetical protein